MAFVPRNVLKNVRLAQKEQRIGIKSRVLLVVIIHIEKSTDGMVKNG